MEITSLYFLILVIVSLFIFYKINPKYRILYLSLLSCGFIASLNINLLVYVLIYAALNYILALKIPSSKNASVLFKVGIIFNLLQLIILRYADFTLNPLINIFNVNFSFSIFSKIIVPIGVSYFTLQGIGYLINIKNGWEKPEKSFIGFLLYIIFFPKFLSGPIERSNHFLPQLNDLVKFDRKQVTEGFRLILFGLLKKDVIANQLGLIVNPVYNDLDASGAGILWAVILIQPLYLYFDFSGYTDIAIGIARTYGIKLLPNFDRPFLAENVTNFWKKFHMSLAFWFNDYVFKQTVFRYRKWGVNASIFAVFITWVLFGIWHGAGWNFMILGLLQALAITIEFLTRAKRIAVFSKFPNYIRKWLGRTYTYIFYAISLVFFFSSDLSTAIKFFSGIKHINTSSPVYLADSKAFFVACVVLLIALVLEYTSYDNQNIRKRIENFMNSSKREYKILRFNFYYLILLIIFYLGGMQAEFIYFQF